VAEETATAEADEPLLKADQLNVVGLDEYALDEVNKVLESAPQSPRLNLAKGRIYRTRQQNLLAFLALQKSYPDFSQMKPEELSREEWDVFYPLAYWDTITREGRARSIDPYRIAGLIRQESVFDPRASSHAHAYGLMQLLLETAQRTARKYGITRTITRDVLLSDPQLNIQIGTGYLRDQLDSFGRIEYVAAAYNAGPGRAVRWRAELPAEMDEWAEAVPFRETRMYVQGVVRNTLQYKRLYDEQGRFRAEIGSRAVRPAAVRSNAPAASTTAQPAGNTTVVRPRRATPGEEELREEQ
jgi:soluble lytic murein transglycosylase